MLSPHLRSVCGYRPNRVRQIKFSPFRHPQLAGPGKDQRQEAHRRQGRAPRFVTVKGAKECAKLRRIGDRRAMLRGGCGERTPDGECRIIVRTCRRKA
ncbi:hypothetical protein M2321_004114 [Rhodoblastus acidophilus]|nr:hypothetical protein [Rhodoblastus acidophilus]MCW2276506.1 hypothetical protein [Rhodoblastus acidophilus]